MASELINLEHLRIAVVKIKDYTSKTYAELDHDHDNFYPTFVYVDEALAKLEEKIVQSSVKEHIHSSSDITKMLDYSIASEQADINVNDSLNTAIGKLEYNIKHIGVQEHDHDGKYLGINDTAKAAQKLEKAVRIEFTGDISGGSTFDGSSDTSVEIFVSELPSSKITSMVGYSKPESPAPVYSTDSLNAAIGKLEAALDLKQDASGSLDIDVVKAYVDQEILEIVGGDDVPTSLNTLKELAAAIGNDPDFSDTVDEKLKYKAEKNHPHDVATVSSNGFMASDDKEKLNNIEERANYYEHPTGSGYMHIPTGGESGQMLAYADDGKAEWVSYTPDSASDSEVVSMLDEIFPIQ